jgi:hypothetical protein
VWSPSPSSPPCSLGSWEKGTEGCFTAWYCCCHQSSFSPTPTATIQTLSLAPHFSPFHPIIIQ